MCAAPNRSLGVALLMVPVCGALLAIVGAGLLAKTVPRAALRSIWIGLLLTAIPPLLHSRFVPNGPVVFYDEFLHAEASANLAAGDGPFACCSYQAGRCVAGGPILWPLSTQAATAALLRLTGATDVTGGMRLRSSFNRMASAAAPPLAWGWSLLLLGDPWAAAFSGLAVAVWPGALRLQSTGDLTPGAILFLLLLLCAVEVYRRRPGWPATIALVGFMALTFHARLEMALITPWLLWRLSRRGPRVARLTIAGAWLAVVAPLVWLYLDGTAHHAFGWEASRDHSLDFIRAHAAANLGFFLDASGALPALLPLALAGTALGPRRGLPALTATAAGLFLFESAYHAGDFRLSGSDGFRYAVSIAVLLAPAAGFAVGTLVRVLPRSLRAAAFGGAVALIVVPLRSALPFLARENVVAASDRAMRAYAAQHPWAANDTIISRSVAYSRELSGAGTIFERCAVSRPSRQDWYLRSWNDHGPSVFPGLCARPAAGAADPGDGLGPWLFRYGDCPAEAISPAPDGRR